MVNQNDEVRMALGFSPAVPAAEAQGRLARARDFTRARGLEAVLHFGNARYPDPVRYLANYVHPFGAATSFLLVQADGDPVLAIDRWWDLETAREMSWVRDVRAFTPVSVDEGRTQAFFRELFLEQKLETARIGICETDMPAVYRRVIHEALPTGSFTNGRGVWQDLVAHPTGFDVEMVRETAVIADEAMKAVLTACRPGQTEHQAALEGYRVVAEMGGEFLHNCGTSTHINIGSSSQIRGNVRSFLHTGRRLQRGDMFWVDMTVYYRGYSIDFDRTVSVGPPSAEQREVYQVCRAAYDALREALRAGRTGEEIYEAGMAVTRDTPFAEKINFVWLGHATGLAAAEAPFLAHAEKRRVVRGQLMNIEPGIFVPGIASSSLEDCFLVSEGLAEPLTRCSLDLHIS